jgi:transposase-like protein
LTSSATRSRLASKKDWDALKTRCGTDLHRSPQRSSRPGALDELADRWGTNYAAIILLWENAWTDLHPFPGLHDVEIRKVICLTNATESLKARYRRE